MGRMYVASGTSTAITTAANLFQLATEDDSVIFIHRFGLRVATTTDEALTVTLSRVGTAATGGTGVNANPLDPGDAADSATILNEPTGEATKTEIGRWNTSTLAGLEIIYTPEERPVLSGAAPTVLFETDLTITSADVSWMIVFEEIG